MVLASAIGIYATSKMQKETYQVDLRLEGSSGYPAELTLIRNQGIEKETVLTSIIPSLRIGRLSVAEPHTTMSGTITIDCGEGYQETENFKLVSYVQGDAMKQEFVFKDITPDRYCRVIAKVLECETEQPRCDTGSVSLTLRIPQ